MVTTPGLVHGLWSDGSRWLGVRARLRALGPGPVAAQLNLETFDDDVASLRRTLATVSGPVALVGWSCGDAVIGEVAKGASQAKALAYVAAFGPGEGESVSELAIRQPGV